MKLFITGVNGFIGTHLLENILEKTDWEIVGFDIFSDNLKPFIGHKNFTFCQGDVFKNLDTIEEKITWSDTVIPLAGVAKPAYYVEKPLWTFELDFESNLKIIKACSQYNKRVIFPSTSEVYGISPDIELKEDESPLMVGPINKMRWIYSCSKQMIDRVITAYGQERGLQYSLFRPFNWIGPRLDTFKDAKERRARSITQMIYDMLYRKEISLVGGGEQRRNFTWVGDAVCGLVKIIENKNGAANGEIFNIGNPYNNYSIKELAYFIIEEAKTFSKFKDAANAVKIKTIPAAEYYGKAYEDMNRRVPCIKKIEEKLGWRPTTDMREAVRKTLEWYALQ